MIDTVAMTFPVELDEEQLKYWPFHHTYETPWYITESSTRNLFVDNVPIKAKYNPPNEKYLEPRLKLEASLPIALYGSNVVQFSDIAEVFAAALVLNSMLETIPGIPKVDVRDGKLNRIDLCCNHWVGDNVHMYVRALFDLDYPKRKTGPYPHQGVQYKSESISTKFYSKYQECEASDALGILRHETTIRSNDYIGRQMGVSTPILRDVTTEWVTDMLNKDLQRLHIDQQMVYTHSMAQDILKVMYGKTRGNRLFGYLYERHTKHRVQMLNSGYSEDEIWRNDKDITKAGVALTFIDTGTPLPALYVSWDDKKVRSCCK